VCTITDLGGALRGTSVVFAAPRAGRPALARGIARLAEDMWVVSMTSQAGVVTRDARSLRAAAMAPADVIGTA